MKANKLKTVVIIPTHNEVESIESVIHQLFKVMREADTPISILVFDSNSSDGTADLVKKLQSQYPFLFLETEPTKTGLGSAYVKAMRYAMDALSADVVIEFDADGSHQPKYIPHMLEKIEAGDDCVIGSRYVPGGKIDANWPWYRFAISYCGSYFARMMLALRYKDFTSGFRATKSSVLKNSLAKDFLSKNYAYKIELLYRLHLGKAQIAEIPIAFIDRTMGYSKFPKNNIQESLKVVLILKYNRMRCLLKQFLRVDK